MKKNFCLFLFVLLIGFADAQQPLRVAVAGISHGHVPWILGRKNDSIMELVGVYETDRQLLEKSAKNYGLQKETLFANLDEMLDRVKPEALVAFGSIYEHLAVVQAAAPRGIHVMVEKPLAVSGEHAARIEELARKYKIHILTNYESSWYPSIHKAYQLHKDSNAVGQLRKLVVHMGHQGPIEIGVSREFLHWLRHPVLNGGGALTDFGCYGANIMTWFMEGEEPESVIAVTKTYKPEKYPEVDDEATIIVNYRNAQCIIQASWNWPFNRKDIALYGDKGYILTKNTREMEFRFSESAPAQTLTAPVSSAGNHADPFSYFAGVIRGKIVVPEYGLYSLKNNLLASRILEAARISAREKRLVVFAEEFFK